MVKRFRALRLVALLLKIFAWILFVSGVLFALFLIVLGAVQGRAGIPSPVVASVPTMSHIMGPLSGLASGLLVLIVAVVQFILGYAASEVVQLALAIEHNTRETAFYLRGENTLPPPPLDVSWDTPESPDLDT